MFGRVRIIGHALASVCTIMCIMYASVGCGTINEITGEKGSLGDSGSQGVPGVVGETGPLGEQWLQGEPGLQGERGIQGDPGFPGDTGATGSAGSDGATGPAGATGAATPVIMTVPAAPTALRLLKYISGPPEFELHWDMAAGAPALNFFIIYESDAAITSGNKASALQTSVSASTKQVVVYLFSDSGIRYFRVAAMSASGIEGTLSVEQKVDTTSRLSYVADQDTDTVLELYTVSASGGTTTKVAAYW